MAYLLMRMVCTECRSTHFLLLSSTGSLQLSNLRKVFPEATGLRFRVGGVILAVFSKEQVLD